jgi:ribose transport system permease protein
VWLRASGGLVGFLALVVLFAVLRPETFLSAVNLRNVLEQVAILAIVACAQTVVMVAGYFDLSVGALASLTGVLAAHLMIGGVPIALVVPVALLAAAVAGAVNGVLVAYLGLSAFVATLATMTSYAGLSLLVAGGTTLLGLPESFMSLGQGKLAGLPVPVVVAVAVAVVLWVVLAFTTLGRRWSAIGDNPEACRLSGLNVPTVKLTAFCVSGAGAGLAGLVLTSRLASAHPSAGDPLMLPSIAAVFLGMTMFRGGRANLPGTIVGVGIFGVLTNGLNILQVSSYVQQALTGLIIIAAVAVSVLVKRR